MALHLVALGASLAALSGCRYHIGCAHNRPNDPNALFEWKGTFHMMWQGDGGWDHAVSLDMARW
jgi:sucrose-6-phosphate hydrolase SacC (GH32 family)|eukprot:COSAG06_NODE_9363_length_1920_cov_1.813839_2_plen_64_part_00